MWEATKAGLRGKFVAFSAYIGNEKPSQLDHLKSSLRTLGKGKQTKPKSNIRRRILGEQKLAILKNKKMV